MKKVTSLLLMLMFLWAGSSWGQTTVTLGTGTTYNGTSAHPTPYGTYYKNHRVQYLILASELTALGVPVSNITSIAFNVQAVNTCSAMPNYTMKLKNTTASALTTTFDNTYYQQVWYYDNFLPVAGWNTHTFTTPFLWDGISNVIVDVCFTLIPGSYTQNASVYYTATTGNTANYYRSDTEAACGTSSAATISVNRANMQITYVPATGCLPPTMLTATNIAQTTADIGWTKIGTETMWNVKYGLHGFDPNTAGTLVSGITNQYYTLTGLEPVTLYDFYVQADCGTDALSAWSVPKSFQTTSTPLAGTYTINSTLPTGGTNFNNFTDFALALNLGGFTGPVTVDVVAGTGPYTEQVIIGTPNNNTSSNPLIINGNGETLQYLSTNTNERATLKLNGTDYVTVDNLNIVALGALSTEYGYAVHLMNLAEHCTFTDCHFTSDLLSTSTNFTAFATSNSATSSSSAALAVNYLTVDNCVSSGGYYGMTINGPTAAPFSVGNVITNNEIKDFYSYGLYTRGQNSAIISGNEISRSNRGVLSTAYMLYLAADYSNTVITKNRIFDFAKMATVSSTAYGIYGTTFSATAGQEALIANNLIYGYAGMASTQYGMYFSTTASLCNLRIYHNTISLDNTAFTGSSNIYGIYQTGASATLDIRNNIISYSTTSTGSKYCLYFNTNTAVVTSNYNDLHIGATVGLNYTGYWNAISYATLADWQTANGGIYDLASSNANPLFTNPAGGDMMPQSGTINGMGTNLLTWVPDDFFGVARTATPDLGAIEFEPPACLPPSNLAALNVTQTGADLGWTPGGTETMWNLEYGEGGFTPGTGTLLTGITTNPYPVSGLEPASFYDFYVQSDCGAGALSGWAGPFTFQTDCPVYDYPLTESFDDAMFPPLCWTRAWITGTGAGLWDRLTAGVHPVITPHSGAGLARYNAWSFSTGTIGILTSPALNIVDDAIAVNFWMYRDDGYLTNADLVNVYFNTTPDLTGATLIGTVNRSKDLTPAVPAIGWYEYTFASPGGINGTVGYIVFEGVSAYGNDIHIDDVSIDAFETGTLAGTVTEASKAPVEGAYVTAGIYSGYTNASGYYEITGMLPATYSVTCEADGYFGQTIEGVIVVGNQTTIQDFALGFAQIQVSPASISQTLLPDATATQTLTISNPSGTEPLTWSASIEEVIPVKDFGNIPLEFGNTTKVSNSDPMKDACSETSVIKSEVTDATWDILQSFTVHATGGEQAVATDGINIYTAKWGTAGAFSKYNLDGTWVEDFTITGAGAIRDLAWDGTYFYGGAAGTILYTLDLAAKTLIGSTTLTGGAQCRHISYDPVADGFWVGNWTTLHLVNRSGAVVTAGPAVVSVYGSAYDGYTAGGPYLWLFAQVAETGCGTANDLVVIQQFHIPTLTFTGVTHCATDIPGYIPGTSTAQTIAGGAFASDVLIPGKFVLMVNIQQSPNVIGVYELAEMETWLSMDTYNGVVNPGESQVVNVNFDAAGLVDSTYLANININHNGQEVTDGTLTVPVAMHVASATPPVPPTLVYPTAGATFIPLQPEFLWTNGPGTAQVQIEIKRGSGGFSVTIHKSLWFQGESYNLADHGITLLKKQLYTWIVRAKNAAGTVSSTRTFTTIGAGTIGGVVTDAFSSSPLQGAIVTIASTGQTATSAADGSYTIANVLEGTYDVTAEFEGYQSQTKSATVVHNQLALTNFTLTELLDPAVGLTATLEDFVNVNLAWHEPGFTGGPVVLLQDDIEDYTAGQKLVQQATAMGRDYWTTWSNAPGTAEDPTVSSAAERNNSVLIEGLNDCVLLLGDKTTGKYNLTFDIRVATGFLGYFNVLHAFAGANSEWGLQVYFDEGGAGLVDAAGAGAATFTFAYDTWIPIKVNVDLDNDWCKFWVDNNLVVEYQWSLGTFGTAGLNQLSAANFYAWSDVALPKFYIDNVVYSDVTNMAFDPTWITWCSDELSDAIGTGAAANFDVAARFEPAQLASFTGGSLTKIAFAPNEVACTYTLSVWQGALPPTLIYSEVVAAPVIGEWNEVTLASPVPFDNSQELWIGYNVNTTTGYPAGCDAGPQVEGFGNMINWGGWTTLTALNAALTYNWSIKGYVEAAKGGVIELGTPVVSNTTNTGHLSASPQKEIPSVFNPNNQSRADLLGYNLYRNNEFVAFTEAMEYQDMNLASGSYDYTLTAVYSQGESDPIGPASVDVLLPPVLISAEADYYGVDLLWQSNVADKIAKGSYSTSDVLKLKYKEPSTKVYDPNKYPLNPKQGGETIATAMPIGALPFYETGTTEGYLNDYDEVCPYTGSTAPDVVYSFTPTEDLLITITLCESLFDTKLYIYENTYTPGNPYACNDDHPDCPEWQSGLDALYVAGGNTYYIVVDAYSTDFGTYTIDITGEPYVPCTVECPTGAISEGEVCAADGYVDTFNGGCNSNPVVYSPIADGDVICGTSSTYVTEGASRRDTDWYELVLESPKTITWTVTAEFPVYAFIINGNLGCAGLSIIAQGAGAPCEPTVASTTVAPGTYWLWVGPQVFEGYPCGGDNDYVAELTMEDAFLTYFDVFRDGVDIADAYGNTYRDENVVNGETYCYTVAEHVSPDYVTPESNELCATVPLIPAIGVNPEALTETHNTPPAYTTTQTVTVTNTALGTLDWNLEVVMNDVTKGAKAYCDASTTTQDEYIANVLCGSINNTSGWQGGVADYTAISTTIEAGAGEPITVTNGNAWASDIVYCWVDWDLSETWDQATNEEFMLTNVGGTGLTFEGTITVPEDVPTGSYRMRVRMTYSTAPVPCGVATYGEVEDYTINVLGGAQWLSADVLAGSLGAGQSANIDVTFNSEDLAFGTYTGALNFWSNDPVTPEFSVPVTFEVTSNLGTLAGLVTDALAKSPVEGVTILVDEVRGYSTTTLADGTYTIDVPEGVYTITAQKAGYISASVTGIMVATGETTIQNFQLEFAAPILTNADPDYFGVMVEWEANPAVGYPYKGGSAAYSLSNVAEKTALSKEERLHGPTVTVPMENKSRATGDDCTDPIVIGGVPYMDVNTTCGRTNNYDATCLGYYDGGEDIIYQLVLTETKTLEFAMTTTDTYTGMLITNECPPTATCIAIATNAGAGGVTITQELAPGTYYIMIDTWPAPTCITQFTLNITEAVLGPGETCELAVTAIEGLNSSPQSPYWYEFTPAESKVVTISSCIEGQEVDTRLYVYDACGGTEVAYNDDLYDACGYYDYASAVSFNATAGVSYKIYWDPYWETTPFDFTIELSDLCQVECPVGAIDEGELCGEDTNGGCNMAVPTFSPIACGDVICGSAWADGTSRDTDWYELVLDAPKTITWSVTAEFNVYAFIIDGNFGCENAYIISLGMGGPCETAVATATLAPGIYWLWVGDQSYYNVNPCGDNNTYVAELTCEDAFVTYFNLYRDGNAVGQFYNTYYYDENVVQGETYCYTVDQVIQPGLITGISNELCVTVPIQPVISVDPMQLTESLEVGETSTQMLEVMNGSAGDLEFEVLTVLGGPVKANAGFTPEYPVAQVSQEAVENVEEGGVQGFTPTFTQPLNSSKDVMWNNGELINSQCATTLAIESMIVAPSTLYGSNFNQAGGYAVADDFTIPEGEWTIDSFDFYGYQTNSTTTSTFTGVYVQIWNGDPLVAGSAPIWGDLTTNVMSATSFTDIYRVSATTSCNVARPIMKITASTPGLTLEAGTYYVAWATTGSLASGPWVPAVNAFVAGSTTGARQLSGGVWAAVESPAASGNFLDFAYNINGSGAGPWLTVTPEYGMINGVGSLYLDVNFDATNLTEGIYTADVNIMSNDPMTPSIVVPVTLYVGMPMQEVMLPMGWSAWSSYMNPDAKMTMEDLMAPVVDNMVITQYFNQLYYPMYNINTLGEFSNEHGYVTKMVEDASLMMMGTMADPTVSLTAGWNLFPVLQECPIAAADVFSNMAGFVIAFEIGGNGIWYPAGSVYTLTDLVPGKAYWVKVTGSVEYTFPGCLTKGGFANVLPLRPVNNTNWNDVSYTGLSHAVIFNQNATSELVRGDVIGAFTSNGICAGLVEVANTSAGFVLFGDDITTAAADGFTEGETLSYKLFRQATGEEFIVDVTYSTQVPNFDGKFVINGLSVISDLTLKSTGINNVDLGNLSIYPNPSTGIFNVVINDLDKDINYTIVNAQGQEVVTGKLLATQQIDLSTQPKGVYFIKFTNETVLRIEKLVIK